MLVNFNWSYNTPSFQRKPNAGEMKSYTKSLNDGLKVLNKNMGLIVHNSSVPSKAGSNLGIGSLLSKNAELAFIPFLAANAFSAIQQDPNNIRGTFDVSPYAPLSTAKNIYMIPIERLSTDEYGYLVGKNQIETIIAKNENRKDANKVDYTHIPENFDKVLRSAYAHFHQNINKNETVYQLQKEFNTYKINTMEEMQPKALYEILSQQYNNEDWRNWDIEHKNLYMSDDKQTLNDLINNNQSEIDYFIFKQWLIERETMKANMRNDALGIKTIGDSPVAYTPVEVWINQDVFMDGWALGCPPDYFSVDGQRWGFPVIKPETIFNQDGTLGKGGKLMKEHYEKLFATSTGGVRIDHVIGLIDPFVYSTKEPKMNDNNSGRLYSSPNHPKLAQYAKHTIEEYAAILEKIVFPAAAKYGLSKEDIICEDLGAVTKPVNTIMNKLNLSGIAVTQYDYRGQDTPAKNIIMPGSHDNESFLEYTNKIFNDKKHLYEKTEKLAKDTSVPQENIESYRDKMRTDKSKFIAASFAELFTSPAKKVQMFFTTFLGIGETYNKPGTTDGCWTLRVPENYDSLYWDNVKKGTAVNLPETIARAIRHKGLDFAAKYKDLLSTLDEFTQILQS